jgi:hypothetical protein
MSGAWPGYAKVSERTTSASPAAPPAAAAASPPTTSATPLSAIKRAPLFLAFTLLARAAAEAHAE